MSSGYTQHDFKARHIELLKTFLKNFIVNLCSQETLSDWYNDLLRVLPVKKGILKECFCFSEVKTVILPYRFLLLRDNKFVQINYASCTYIYNSSYE